MKLNITPEWLGCQSDDPGGLLAISPELLHQIKNQYKFDAPDHMTGDPLVYILTDGKKFKAEVTACFFAKMKDDEDFFFLYIHCDQPSLGIQLSFNKDLKPTWIEEGHYVQGDHGYYQVDGTEKNIKVAKKLIKAVLHTMRSLPIKPCEDCGGRGLIGSDEEITLDARICKDLGMPVDMDALNARICKACHLSGSTPLTAPKEIRVKIRW
jgi:hypothetical protein